ncbi:MAG: hypothetical protein ACOC56_04855 [Atribacterota bacterium]
MATPFTEYTGDLAGSFGALIGGTLSILIKVLVGIAFLALIGGLLYWRKKKKSYNIPVTIWIPRSDGKIIDEIEGIGGYFRIKQKEGGYVTVFRLKRKGMSTTEIPPPASKFLVGLNRHLYLIQKGVDDFEPVLPESFRYINTEKGKRIAITNLKCINQDATAWVEDNRENAKKRFTLHGFWDRYKDFIQMSVFLFIVMIAVYIQYIGLKEVVEGLQQVARSLSPAVSKAGSTTVKTILSLVR